MVSDVVNSDSVGTDCLATSDVVQVTPRYSVPEVTGCAMAVFVDDIEVSGVFLQAQIKMTIEVES